MGILDEAIREHLALKRRQGSLSDDELKRLEDEAFGPPTRPGEPDFPTEEGGDGEPESSEEREGSLEVGSASEALEAATGQPSLEGVEVEPIDGVDEVQGVARPSPTDEEAGGTGPFTEEADGSAWSGPPTEEAEAPAEGEPEAPEEAVADDDSSAFYERTEEGELDFGELDLDLEDEPGEADEIDEAADETGEEPEAGAAPAPATEEAELPIESLDTVEHPVGEEEAESDEFRFEEPDSEERERDDAHDPVQGPAEGREPGETPAEGEDVLEETPEFLRDAPEDDELWFEQGEPKDFDF